ncbi:hypothetical protein EH244_26980 [Variovorax beijingensis]|uniref:Mor transcription activator domain-containing protein n=1 Tax=Variovorax beijingensis TaxID=2496117 RepID=A0A3P3E898_9BURK|nr:hypothetical protein EH244_26980 [Variovorax beijingensis]
MTPPDLNDGPLAVIEEEARAMAQCFGIGNPAEAAASLIDRILMRLGGAHIYVPKKSTQKREQIHYEIQSRFNGGNLFELARQYGLTPRHVRRIIAGRKLG